MAGWIAYHRVSTSQQGASGLGLAAQKELVMRFIGNDPLLAEFTEVESGKRHKDRPQLLAALDLCKKKRAKLVIAKLDRLSRNVAFIAELMESGVEFVCCDNPHATKLMLHMLAAFAQHERETISLRIKEALAQVKRDLAKHGSRVSKAGRVYMKLGGPKLAEARAKAAALRQVRRPAENTLAFMQRLRADRTSLREIAAHLNSMDIRTPQGSRWYASTVRAALLRENAKERMNAMAHPLYDDIVEERNHACADTSLLPEAGFGSIPAVFASTAGREAKTSGGMPMPSDIKQAERMLDLFTSVGAASFVVTKTDIEQKLLWGKTYSAAELRDKLPAMVRTAATRKPHHLPSGQTAIAGENLIIRPTAAETCFVQLDDLSAEQLDRVRPASFLIHATSPGNHQAWIAVSSVAKLDTKDFVRRVRKAVGDADKSASGASRIAGSENWKIKNLPEPPVVTIIHGVPGRIMTPEQLHGMELLVELEPVKVPVIAPAPRHVAYDRPWPSYEITLSRTRPKKVGSGPDRSLADYSWAMIAITGGKSIEDTIVRLMEVSERARERAARGDEGYARITVENAAAAVARNWGRNRG